MLNIEPAITVRALEAATGENVTDGARGTVSEGAYADSLRPAGECHGNTLAVNATMVSIP